MKETLSNGGRSKVISHVALIVVQFTFRHGTQGGVIPNVAPQSEEEI
jgi:hypothetical protein